MTRSTNARLAGVAFLFYIAAGMTQMALHGHKHAVDVLTLFTGLSALVLGVTLYAITRVQDPDIALLGLVCRVIEATGGGFETAAFFFAVGSTAFAWLLLRGRMIPVALAWLGVLASVLLVVLLPVQRAGLFSGAFRGTSSIAWLEWLPMLVFEVTLAVWFLVKGVSAAHAPLPEAI